MDKLLHSREFWAAVIAAVFNLTLFFIGKYQPSLIDDVKFVISTLDPIIAVIIGALFVQTQVAKMEARINAALAAK